MPVTFSERCEQDIRHAPFVRVAVYPAVRGWCGERVQLEVANARETLGVTDLASCAGHYLVVDGAEEARAEAARLRGKVVEIVRL